MASQTKRLQGLLVKWKKAYFLSVWNQYSHDSDLTSPLSVRQGAKYFHTHTHTHTHTHPHINTTSPVATHHMLLFLISVGHHERKIMKSLHRPGTLLTRCKQQHSWRQCYVTVRRESSGVSGSKSWVLLREGYVILGKILDFCIPQLCDYKFQIIPTLQDRCNDYMW